MPKRQHKAGPWQAYLRLQAEASALELFIRFLAIWASIGAGVAYPLMAVIFGNLVNDFNGWGSGEISPSEFRHSVSHNALWFVYLFAGKVVVSKSILLQSKFMRSLSSLPNFQCKMSMASEQSADERLNEGYRGCAKEEGISSKLLRS